jgi:hypothetical protein
VLRPELHQNDEGSGTRVCWLFRLSLQKETFVRDGLFHIVKDNKILNKKSGPSSIKLLD